MRYQCLAIFWLIKPNADTLAICLTTANLHNGFYIPLLHAASLLADVLHRNNSPNLMWWNAFNCEACWSSHWSTHCWSNWEFIGDLINIDRPRRALQSHLLMFVAHCPVPPPWKTFLIFLSGQLFRWVRNSQLLAAALMMVCILPRCTKSSSQLPSRCAGVQARQLSPDGQSSVAKWKAG